ncbi:hypothetical protein EC973_002776 [Apophysomyces ossiformis]|uniref:Uncharacterized protein n=1 Tax=Apophysomyces ossiformis TaxID=679940 RepID=A0A8H7ETP2_9FUNG|nr:hypothetical protein EC973_002776 [Apophysomyces ossiformis]
MNKQYDWGMKWMNSDMNSLRNCVLIDEAGSNIKFAAVIGNPSHLVNDKCLSASAAAKQAKNLRRMAQRWAKQYEKDPDSILEKWQKTSRPCLLNQEHKKVILGCINESPSTILEQVMEQLKQNFTEIEVSMSTLHEFI